MVGAQWKLRKIVGVRWSPRWIAGDPWNPRKMINILKNTQRR
jgi:hypothetical protein